MSGPAQPKVIIERAERCVVTASYKLRRNKSLKSKLELMQRGCLIKTQTDHGPAVERTILNCRVKRRGNYVLVAIDYEL